MATKIRLKRIGRRNRPFYRMVAMDSRNRRDGAAIEELGWYNPIDTNHSYDLKDERILHWLGEGAQPTDAAKKLLRRTGLSHRWHLMQQGLESSELEKEMKKWEMNRENVLKSRAEKDEQKAKETAKNKEESVSSKELNEKVVTTTDDSHEHKDSDKDSSNGELDKPENIDLDDLSQEEE